MKRILLISILFLSNITLNHAQGLEDVIVETYYISDANDATVNSTGGVLPVGSVTYRIYIDMLPDYIFQSAYGAPNQELRIATTTLFFNNEDRGAVHPTFNFSFCDDNTVMLDSWLSVGAACNGRFGVLKSEDDGVGTVVNSDGVLLNNAPLMGIPLTQQDGLFIGTPEPVITVGISNDITVFDSQNDGTNGPLFSTFNGAWAAVPGSSGPDPVLNQVLIAQITTDGDFSFALNIQIRNEITQAVENYVSSNPTGADILDSSLTWSSLNTSLNEVSQYSPTFGVYPVPASNQVTISTNASQKNFETTYKIFDILGNRVLEGNLGNVSGIQKHVLNISQLNSGVYFLELNFDGELISRKIVKQ